QPGAADDDEHDAGKLRGSQVAHHDRIYPHEFDQEPRPAGEYQIPAEHGPVGLGRSPPAPQERGDGEVGQRLVDGCWMYADTRWIRPPPPRVRVRHPPGYRRDRAPVAVAGELAADPPDGLPDDERGRHRIRPAPPGDAVPAEEERHRQRAAHQAAVEDEP